MASKDRRKAGFRVGRIRSLLGDDAAPEVDVWLERLGDLARTRTAAKVQLQGLLAALAGYVKDLDTFDDPQVIKDQFGQAWEGIPRSRSSRPLWGGRAGACAILDRGHRCRERYGGWQDLIDLARDPDGLRSTLIERHARTALREELIRPYGRSTGGMRRSSTTSLTT